MEKPSDKDRLGIKAWADNQADILRADIRYHIAQGMDKKQAVELVLATGTMLGSGYIAQIRYEFK